MPRFRLLATDLDGSLIDASSCPSPRARAALEALRRRGVLVVPSTARPPRSVLPIYRDLGLDGPAIAINGALVYHPDFPEPFLHRSLDRATALEVVAAIRAVDARINVGVEAPSGWYVDRLNDRIREALVSGRIPAAPIDGDVAAALAATEEGASKVYFVETEPARAALEARFATTGLAERVFVTSSSAGFVEILAAGVDKGSALAALAAVLGIPLEQTVAIGDEENDIGALRVVGLGIAMGHARPEVRAAADVVTGPLAADGWAEAMERWVLGEV